MLPATTEATEFRGNPLQIIVLRYAGRGPSNRPLSMQCMKGALPTQSAEMRAPLQSGGADGIASERLHMRPRRPEHLLQVNCNIITVSSTW